MGICFGKIETLSYGKVEGGLEILPYSGVCLSHCKPQFETIYFLIIHYITIFAVRHPKISLTRHFLPDTMKERGERYDYLQKQAPYQRRRTGCGISRCQGISSRRAWEEGVYGIVRIRIIPN